MQGWKVDYFASVFTGTTKMWSYGTGVSFEEDPLFAKIAQYPIDSASVSKVISSTLESAGARIPFIKVFDRHDTAGQDESFIHPTHGKVMWGALGKGHIARNNFILLVKELEALWDVAEKEEKINKQQYSYVMILRDDAWWVKDFDLDLMLQKGGVRRTTGHQNKGHLYSLLCKRIVTKGIIDYAFVLDRTAAEIVGRSYSRIVRPADFGTTWLQLLNSGRCKNSENFFIQLANFTGLEVFEVPITLIPMQRAGRMNNSICLHKFCDSFPRTSTPDFEPPLSKCKARLKDLK